MVAEKVARGLVFEHRASSPRTPFAAGIRKATVLALLSLHALATVAATANTAESSALLGLHDFCGWSLGWSSAVDACEGGPLGFGWDGIECDASDHHVEKVELQERNLACNLTGLDNVATFDPSVFTRLISFTILGAQLFGQLPESFCKLPSLTMLNLDDNDLEADLTNYSFASSTLATLRMNRNRLYGKIPNSLAGHQHLVELDLSFNNLTGDIVSKLSSSAALVFVDLSSNGFSGELPIFGTESHLAALKVSDNSFSGTIPDSIGAFGSEGNGLIVLHINGNQLTGTLPQAISSLAKLEEIDVSNNLLSGHLPALHTMSTLVSGGSSSVRLGGGNVFACPVPSASPIYDSAVCTCAAGSYGTKGAFDGVQWNATTCRDGVNQSILAACVDLGRFSCASCAPGTFSASAWSQTCEQCASGYFEVLKESTECVGCREGFFSALNGTTVCDECAFGAWSDPMASECTQCAPGFYESFDGENRCDLCPSGKYQPLAAATECEALPRGYVGGSCNFGETGCADKVACSPGFFGPRVNGTECLECAAGYISAVPGASICRECAAGEFSSRNASVSCISCEPGRFGIDAGATTCVDCAHSFISSREGATECSGCAAGRYADDRATRCLNCPAGSMALDNHTCVHCGFGTHQSLPGQQLCVECAAGRYADSLGQVVCALCPAGRTSNASASVCSKCPSKMVSTIGSSTCYSCGEDSYSSADQQSCISCDDIQTFVADGEPGVKCGTLSTEAATAIGAVMAIVFVAIIVVIGGMLCMQQRIAAGTHGNSRIVPTQEVVGLAQQRNLSLAQLKAERRRILDDRQHWKPVNSSEHGPWFVACQGCCTRHNGLVALLKSAVCFLADCDRYMRKDLSLNGTFGTKLLQCLGCAQRFTLVHFDRNPFREVPTSVDHHDFDHESAWQLCFSELGNFFFFSGKHDGGAQRSNSEVLEWARDWPTDGFSTFQLVRVLNSPSTDSHDDNRRVNDKESVVISLLGATISFGSSNGSPLDVQNHQLHVPLATAKRAGVAVNDRSSLWLELPPLHEAPVESVDRNPLHRMWRRLALDPYTSKV